MRGREGYRNLLTGEDMAGETYKILYDVRSNFEVKPNIELDNVTANNLWATNRTPAREQAFLSVVLPWRAAEEAPSFERLSDTRFRVAWPDGVADTIAFGAGEDGDTACVDFVGVQERAKALEEAFLNRR